MTEVDLPMMRRVSEFDVGQVTRLDWLKEDVEEEGHDD
jgi:hypothetical protein